MCSIHFKPHRGKRYCDGARYGGTALGGTSAISHRGIFRLAARWATRLRRRSGLRWGLPDEKVVLFDAEGSLLMNLGVLASIAGKKPANFVHFVLDNECYATTGGQPVPNSAEID